jgi:hypothetical protein
MSGIKLNMNSLEISPIEIEDLTLSNFNSNFSYSHGELKNAKMRFQVKVVLTCKDKTEFKFLGQSIDSLVQQQSIDLFNFDTDFVDIDAVMIPEGKMKITLPRLSIGKFKQDLLQTDEPSSKITANNMDIHQISMDETVMEGSSPALFGGFIPIKNPLGPQNMSISGVKMKDFTALQIKMPPFNLTNLHMQTIEIKEVVSDNFLTKGHINKTSPVYTIPDLISIWATIEITVSMKADKVVYNNLRGDITADKTSMKGMTMDFRLKDIQFKDLRIDKFDMPDIGVGL